MNRKAAWPLLLLLAACEAPVAASLAEDDANRVVVALGRSGVHGTKEIDPGTEGRYRVLVDRDEVSRAVAVLRDEELPPRPTPGVLDAMGKSSLVPSVAVEQAQFIAGLSGDLERTLTSIDGIVAARVHLSVPPRGPLDRDPGKPTASVLLKHRGPTSPVEPEAVQRLVAGALAGLDPQNVAVVLVARLPQAAAPGVDLSRLGPITVTRATAGALRALVVVALLASLLPTVALLLVWQRSRRALAAALAPGGPPA